MKAKWVKAAGLLAAGSLVFSAAYIDGKPGVKDTQEVMAESTDSQICLLYTSPSPRDA